MIYRLFAIVLFVTLVSCNDNKSSNGVIDPYINSEILVVDSNGVILGGDYSDWCLQDTVGPYQFGFGPAYPNPITSYFKVRFYTPITSIATVYFLHNTDTLFVVDNQSVSAGVYEVIANRAAYPFNDEIQKLYIRLGSTSTSFNCEGDIQF